MNNNFRQYYDLESVLFDKLGKKFQKQGYLTAFDFFCIVIWKANRAKSYIAKRLLSRGYSDLELAVKELTQGIENQPNSKERMRYLFEDWGFYLPMASAILTVLYPDDFTVYDVNVCDMLGKFHDIGNTSKFEKLWNSYLDFIHAVKETAPQKLTLRDKDRYLIGKAFFKNLTKDLETNFQR